MSEPTFRIREGPIGAPCVKCCVAALRVEYRLELEARELGTHSLSGSHMKVSAHGAKWPYVVCDNCGEESRGGIVKRPWHEIAPEDAVNITLPDPRIDGPLAMSGDPCPWPWEPQQLIGVPLGQYHCSYCGSMCLAGAAHPDYRDDGDSDGLHGTQ